MKIYVGCSLTQAPENFRNKVEDFKKKLRETNHEILEFIGLEAGDHGDVYDHDIVNCVYGCDMFIAIMDYPSIGLGYELGTSVEGLKKNTIMIVKKGSSLTRLVRGVSIRKKIPLYEYDDLLGDGLKEVLKYL